ncbi:hypothetical protein [Mycetocola zhadangensis]|uniref:Uncharacterized protein n=1 Tax=Mycetocola zhadangensis TaxID=1164595 RepID=A0A3L7J1G2_9MICO|nr:hypothetical protein [Mycetocola zhadangensis]RLQ84229.1 hypothetical protein D9V28_08435 [Mycetocola zhadangensis]GGE94904.1 hypothetical protein GCM10011313_17360 [Mycetocola zhadangensis]
METLAVVLPWVCVAIFLLTVFMLLFRSRNADRMRDSWLQLNAQPRLNFVFGCVHLLIALGLLVLGVAFIQVGYTFGWGFFPLAATQIFGVAFCFWIARQRFDEDS